MGQRWRDIKGYEGLYQVSNEGSVRSIKRGVVKKSTIQNTGYLINSLCKNGKKKMKRTHRLVAEAFIPNPYNLSQVNHKDENKTNNHVDNLEWCSQKDNLNYGSRNKRISESRINNPKISKPVIQLSLDGQVVNEWESMSEAGRNGYNPSAIHKCCNNKSNHHRGFNWKYKE